MQPETTEEQAKFARDLHVLKTKDNSRANKATAVHALGVDPDNYDKIRGIEEPTYNLGKINWILDNGPRDWNHAKALTTNYIKKEGDLLLFAHARDKIKGKPQMLMEVKQTIPLVIMAEKKDKESGDLKTVYRFIDDRYDKRFDGVEVESLEQSFYVYRVVYNELEYMVFSEEKLDPELYVFSGMSVKMPVGAELTKTLKIRSIAKIFFVYKAVNAIKVMPKEELIEFTKDLRERCGFDAISFRDLLFSHPDGKVYLHTDKYNLIRIAQLLSGKYEGYPLSMGNMGALALGKTKELEALDDKFQEPKGICEAGNSTPKVLVPSFKEKPANPGYILSCNRIALVDELMKMVDNANSGTRQGEIVRNCLGQLNMLLEHKKRTVGSGNDNTLVAKATAKCIFAMNPLSGKSYLRDHLSLLDATTMSRILWLVQDQEEQDFIRQNKPFQFLKSSQQNVVTHTEPMQHSGLDIDKIGSMYSLCVTTDIIVAVYDSCQHFLSFFDEEKVRKLFDLSCQFVQEPMKSVWKGRGLHHTILLLDGLVKYRCLFTDYDSSFEAKEVDYYQLEALLIHIVKSWDTDMSFQAYRSRGVLA